MYQLSPEETDCIYERLQHQSVSNNKLQQELFDHFCCFTEEQMSKGKTFEDAYAAAYKAITPNGLHEIELELFFLKNFNKQLNMKRIIFVTGFFAFFLLSTGIMFKTFHWLGAQVIIITALFALLLTTLGAAWHLLRYAREKPASFWYRALTGIAGVFFIATGLLFKSFYFPGAHILYGTGTLILNFLFIPILFYHTYKSGFLRI